jgi:hypothetical protein
MLSGGESARLINFYKFHSPCRHLGFHLSHPQTFILQCCCYKLHVDRILTLPTARTGDGPGTVRGFIIAQRLVFAP